MTLVQGISFIKDNSTFSVKYISPARKISNLREEFKNDALLISKAYGKVYLAFSSGVDSQIILRSFLDAKVEFEAVFLYVKGHNEIEYRQLLECQRFFGIDIRVIEVEVEELKAEWLRDNSNNSVNSLVQYPFDYLSKQLEEDWPIVTQGKSEPAIVGNNKSCCIYHNYYEAMELRFSLIRRHREVIDFPFSPEAIASYYTDDNLKTFVSTYGYYTANNRSPSEILQSFNNFAKPFVKGRYFKNDILWFPKLNGAEEYPEWLLQMDFNTDFRVSVPYWDLTKFLENSTSQEKIYSDWLF